MIELVCELPPSYRVILYSSKKYYVSFEPPVEFSIEGRSGTLAKCKVDPVTIEDLDSGSVGSRFSVEKDEIGICYDSCENVISFIVSEDAVAFHNTSRKNIKIFSEK